MDFLKHSLATQRKFTRWELLGCLEAKLSAERFQAIKDKSNAVLLYTIIEVVYADDPSKVEEIKAAYAHPKTENDQQDDEEDEEIQQLLQEMAITDQVNSGDLKNWKSELDRKRANHLHNICARRRWEAEDAQLKKKKRADVIRQSKKLRKRLKVFKKRGKGAPASSTEFHHAAGLPQKHYNRLYTQ